MVERGKERREEGIRSNLRTNGPVNAYLISWPSKAQNIQNIENIWLRNDLDLKNSHTHYSTSCLLDGVSPSVFRCTSIPMETGPIVTCGKT